MSLQSAVSTAREIFGLKSSDKTVSGYTRFPLQAALAELGEFNAKTGNLAGGCIIRVIADEEPIHILGWINSHNHDPITVKLCADGTSQWRFSDSIDDEITMSTDWREDFENSKYAPGVRDILQRHSASLFNAGIIPSALFDGPTLEVR